MAITNPQAVEFSQQYCRPMAEMLRWLQATGNDMNAVWNGGVSALMTNDVDDIVQDSNVGQHPYSGANANTVMARLQAVLAVLNADYAMDGVVPVCVRALGPSAGPQG